MLKRFIIFELRIDISNRGVGMSINTHPKAILIDVTYERGQLVFNSPESDEPLVLDEEDLEFDAEKLVPVSISENQFQLMHLGKRYDEWFNNLLKPKEGT